jgi:hypothetical protein
VLGNKTSMALINAKSSVANATTAWQEKLQQHASGQRQGARHIAAGAV